MNALLIRETLKRSGPKAVEKELALISRDYGDEALAVIAEELSPAELSQILDDGDFTKHSVIAHFITPEKLFGILERVAAKWGSLRDASMNALLSLMRDVSDKILPTLLHAEPPQRKALLQALLADSLARNFIISLPLHEYECRSFFGDFDPSAGQHGNWQELYVSIHDLLPEEFRRLKGAVLGLLKKEESEDEDAEGQSRDADAFTKRALQALSDRASELVAAHPEEAPKEELFNKF